MFSEEIKKTTAALLHQGKFIGTGTVFLFEGNLYVLTAAHNVYGNDFNSKFLVDEWTIEDYEGEQHKIISVNKDEDFSKLHDVALLTINCGTSLTKFTSIHFAPRPTADVQDFFFRGRYGNKPDPVNKGGIRFQEVYKKSPYQFLGTIDKEQLIDHNYSTGNDWLGGCSGSGLFMSDRDEIICCGILLEIPDKGDNGQLHFCSTEVLPSLGITPDLLTAQAYVFDPKTFSDKWFKDRQEISIESLGKRYTPKLNFDLPIAHDLEGLLRTRDFKKHMDLPLAKIFKTRRSCYAALGNTLTDSQKVQIDALLETLRTMYLALKVEGFKRLDLEPLTLTCDSIRTILNECLEIFYVAQEKEENAKPTSHHGTPPFHNAIHEIYAFRNAIDKFIEFLSSVNCQLTNRPFLILDGEAGFGKSHLLGDFCSKAQEQGYQTVLLLGQHFVGVDNPWHQLLQRQLNLQITEDEFLGKLNIKAQLTGKRIILVIDAINEGNGKEIWPESLKTFIKKVAQFEGLGLILSVRTSYHNLIVDESIYKEDLASNLTHYGFAEFEYEASDHFFDNYNIKKPSIPLLHPEFRSPLFLKLFCDGLAAKGLSEIPPGYEGISAILDFFLDAVNNKLAAQMQFDPAIKVVRASVECMAKEIISTGNSYISYAEAVKILAALDEAKLTNSPGLLASKLVDEGVLAKNIFTKIDHNTEEGVYFLYERFLDHITASMLIKELDDDPNNAFLAGGNLYEYFKDEQSCIINSGLVEAFSIQFPEKYNKEFFEFVPHVRDCSIITEALIAGIVWRKSNNLNNLPESAFSVFLREMLPKHHLTGMFMETILLISGVPGHPLNAEYSHKILMGKSMAERDSGYSHWLAHNFANQGSGVKRLIDWSWKDLYRQEISDESILLSAMALSWFLISPDRNIRDGATKSIICLLKDREHLIKPLLQKFEGINDPYVYERLFGIAYGCTIRAEKFKFISELASYIYTTIFNQDLVYPNILLRDYATGVVNFAAMKGLSGQVDIKKCNPPFASVPIPNCPTNEEIDAKYKLKSEDDKNYHYQNEILDSMTTEYGRGIARYGDFGRYVFGNALSDWKSVHEGELSNYAIERIFELGYNIKMHGNYDANFGHGDGKERIGKKYQWIVLHEVLARVADHESMTSEIDRKTIIPYQGAWQPGVRDIDVSMIIKTTKDQQEIPESHKCWWLPENKLDFKLTNKEWMGTDKDLPSDAAQIFVTDKDGVEWVCLNIHISQSQEPEITDENYRNPQKNLSKYLTAYLIPEIEFESIKSWIPVRDRYNDELPEAAHQTQLFSREYYWSPAYTFFQQYYYGGNGDATIYSSKLDQEVAKIHLPSQYILWEKRRDYSVAEGLTFYKPSTQLKEGLDLKFSHNEGELVTQDGQLACFDPSVNNNGPSCLLVRKDLLLKYLEDNKLKIFWLIDGEKRILSDNNSGDDQNPKIEHNFNGFYYIEGNELKGSGNSKIKTYK